MKNISKNNWEKFNKVQNYTFNYDGFEIVVKNNITVDQRHQFSEMLYAVLYSGDENGIYQYRPYLVSTAVRAIFFKMFTNIDIKDNQWKDATDSLCNSDLFDMCLSEENQFAPEFLKLFSSAEQYCEIKYQENVKTSSDQAIGYLINVFSSLIENVNIDSINKFIDNFNKDVDDSGKNKAIGDLV